ncbi:AAA family ATPase [Virgibacillus litoralis]|uniref:Nuclease SbcCD subunit C n=1 Tax=Virgibacillus litoralis TaxID=578221 RepID=A0ABS4HIL3_9BACI|nr:AAA family ATPase [Virgibacillus litoralis]MBP1950757.1 exonuclease SbcC [Virgibacillus litoralis]
MRAISLSLTAFGPYWKKQVIDFNELGGESVFLITGPTGAGKTTIFDAICFALYGRASGSDRDQDTLRSHFASIDEPTEVKFRFILNQKEYEVIRNPKQSKKKERGEGYTDEPAKAVLYEIVNDEKQLISSRVKEVSESLEEKLGFDYEQFRKMILIPQGEFRKLISENSKEREVILQKIFHTYFYEQITEELKEQSKGLKDKINNLDQLIQQEVAKIEWTAIELDETDNIDHVMQKLVQEIESLKEQQVESEKLKISKTQELKGAQNNLHKGKSLEEKYLEAEFLNKEKKDLNQQADIIEQKKKELKQAKNAQKIQPFEEQSYARRKEWQEQQTQLNKQQEKVIKLEEEYETISAKYNEEAEKESDREQLKETIAKASEQLKQIGIYQEEENNARKIRKTHENLKTELDKLKEKITIRDNKIEEIENKLSDDQEITRAYYSKSTEVEKAHQMVRKISELAKENKRLQELRADFKSVHSKYYDMQKEIERLRTNYNELEAKQREHYAALMAKQLHDNSPCPVCGSLDHPHKAEAHEEIVLIDELDQLQEKLQQKEKEFAAFQTTYTDSKSKGQSQRATVNKLYEELTEELQSIELGEINNKLNIWNEKVKTLTLEQNQLQKNLEEKQMFKTEQMALKQENKEFKQTFDQLTENFQKTSSSLAKIEARLDEIAKHLPPEIEDFKSFQKKISHYEETYQAWLTKWETTKEKYQQTQESLQKEKTILEQQKEFERNTKNNYDIQYNLFAESIEENGFKTIEDYEKSKLSPGYQEEIEQNIKTYENKTEQITYRLKELENQLKETTRPNLNMLEEIADKKQTELQSIYDSLNTLDTRIKYNHQIKTTIKEKSNIQKKLSEEYYEIGELAELAYGNNQLRLSFERYVLASFLDEILLQSNVRLDRMTEHRYQLIRSGQVAKRGAQSGLDLEVLDHHTGRQRSVKTLSGGEGFKAALCLALGLADVVQAHAGGVQLDTLFIDEGFGTLDDVSLQQAIDCLKDLQDSNRLLGIISHVPHLKSEIHAKLQITSSNQGSELEFSFG